jgi:hypothetical protein
VATDHSFILRPTLLGRGMTRVLIIDQDTGEEETKLRGRPCWVGV